MFLKIVITSSGLILAKKRVPESGFGGRDRSGFEVGGRPAEFEAGALIASSAALPQPGVFRPTLPRSRTFGKVGTVLLDATVDTTFQVLKKSNNNNKDFSKQFN